MLTPENATPSTPEEEPSIDLRQYLALFRQWWWLVALATVLAGAAVFGVSTQMTPIYQASTTLLINEAPSNKTADYNNLLTSERLAKTYSEMITKRPVLEKVIDRLGIPYTADTLGPMVTVTPVRDTQLITVTVESPDPGLSPAIANALVLEFTEQLQDTQSSRFAASKDNLTRQIADAETQIAQTRAAMEKTQDPAETSRLETRLNQYEQIYANLVVSYEQIRTTEAQSSSNVVQIERAVVEPKPVKPKTMQNTLLAAVVGMMLAVGGIFAYDALDDTVKSPEDIRKALKLPVMGAIVHYDEPDDGRLITQAEPRSPVAESFRSLRTNVQYASVDTPVRTLLITSPTPGDGKTTVASNLAVVMSQSRKKVTLIDADLHRPRVHRVFGAEIAPGLSNLFVQPRVHLNGEFQRTSMDSLYVVSAGKLPPNPSELLGSNKMHEILDVTLQNSDIAIIDTPPVLSVTDAVVLAPSMDAVLLVVRPGKTRMSALKHAVEQLRYVNANLVGVVLNDINQAAPRYQYYYKGYEYQTYKYGPRKEEGKGKHVTHRAKKQAEEIEKEKEDGIIQN